jgi:NADH-quinone oxidoreductase subunit N
VAAFNGLASRSPVMALAMTICLVSLVGLPPAAGFFAKWKIMSALATAGGAWWWLVGIIALNTVISLAYYARILRAMYFQPAARQAEARVSILGVACAIGLILMLVFFAPLERYAQRLSDTFAASR